MTPAFTQMAPTKGCVVHCRSHHHLVEEVFWGREVDARMLGQSTWETIGQRGFDDPRVFSSYLHTLEWNCVTATDPGLFQAPRALEPGATPRDDGAHGCHSASTCDP